jgi:hypothetical protein
MLPTLNLISALAAVVFFFLPWTSIECRGERMATQTGLQLISGSAKMEPSTDPVRIQIGTTEDASLGNSYLAGAALFCAASGSILALAAVFNGKRELSSASGILCTVALVCLITQASLGFPAKETMVKRFSGAPSAGKSASPLDSLGEEISREVIDRLQVHPLPWFYLELAALGIPALLFVNRLLDRMRIATERRG